VKARPSFAGSQEVGAGDFYFAINATFRFIEKQFGRDGKCIA
jgi:hypothetical protein